MTLVLAAAAAIVVVLLIVVGVQRRDLRAARSDDRTNQRGALIDATSGGAVIPRPTMAPGAGGEAHVEPANGVGDDRVRLEVDFLGELIDAKEVVDRLRAKAPKSAGPVATFLATLLSNEQVVGTLGARVGYWIVRAPALTTWMTANGSQVAQAVGSQGAGARAVIVGGSAAALTPAGIAAITAALAHQALVRQIRAVGELVSLVHRRQVSEVLAFADRGEIAIRDLLAVSADDPRRWPPVLLHEVVRLHGLAGDQSAASIRFRELLLAGTADASARPPTDATSGEAVAELEAAYKIHLVSAQLAAARAVHARACGDDVTASAMYQQASRSLESFAEHHAVMAEIVAKPDPLRPWKREYGRSIARMHDHYADVIEQLTGRGTVFLVPATAPGEAIELTAEDVDEMGIGTETEPADEGSVGDP